VQTPGVAAAFAKKIEAMGKRMIAPDALLELKATDTRGDGASLAAVEPTVGSPGKRVCDRMGVLHAKTGEENFGVGIGHIIGIAVRIKKQVRSLKDEHAAVAKGKTAGQIQAIDKVLRLDGEAVLIDFFENSDTVGAFWPLW